ncbi:MAG: XRE family transcriptional regulator [Gemmatimonadaceae bacterium]
MSFEHAVRARRQSLGLSLQQLAERSGVSAGMLSEVERGRKSPTLRVASQIAEGLEVAVSELLDGEPAPRMRVRRRAERRRLIDEKSAIERHLLAPTLLANGIEVVWYVVPPGSESGTFAPQHNGVLSHATVVRGTIEFDAEGEQAVLRAGDSIDFPGDITHAFRNSGRGPCEFLLVVDTRRR